MAVRERIEGLFHQLQNTGRNLKRLLARTIDGLVIRLALNILGLTQTTLPSP